MKASDFGVKVPSSVGNVAYAMSEDGNGDGVWSNTADSEADAIEELKAECESDDEEFHGYIADVQEAVIDGPDAERIIEDVSEWAWGKYGEVAECWPNANKEQTEVLQSRLDKVFGEWLTEFNLWPGFTAIKNIRKAVASEG
jgi:hypothetical protein